MIKAKNFDMIGHLRSAVAGEDAEVSRLLKVGLIAPVREMGRDCITEDVVSYVTDNALPRKFYASGMRELVTADDVYHLLACSLDYFELENRLHYALVREWWGEHVALAVFGCRTWYIEDEVFVSLQDWFVQDLKDKGVAYLELQSWHSYDGLQAHVQMVDDPYDYTNYEIIEELDLGDEIEMFFGLMCAAAYQARLDTVLCFGTYTEREGYDVVAHTITYDELAEYTRVGADIDEILSESARPRMHRGTPVRRPQESNIFDNVPDWTPEEALEVAVQVMETEMGEEE